MLISLLIDDLRAHRGFRTSDRALGLEGANLRLAVAELLQDLVTMLAEQRRRRDRRRRRRELDGVADRDVAPPHGVLDLDDHGTGLKMRVGQDLAGVETRAARHAGAGQYLHDLVLRALRRPRLDQRIDLGLVAPAGVGRLVARVADEVGAADRAQQRMPHLLLREDEDVVVGPTAATTIRRARHAAAELVARPLHRLSETLV